MNNFGRLVTGSKIRVNNPDLYDKKQNVQNSDLFKKFNNLKLSNNAEPFINICNKLVVGLRGRYSGCLEANDKIKLFNRDNSHGNIYITELGTTKLLQAISNEFNGDDAKLLIQMCTHRHTWISKVESYPETLKHFFRLNNTQDLIKLSEKIQSCITQPESSLFYA